MLTNRKVLLIAITLLTIFVLSGCARLIDADGRVLPEKIIAVSTEFNTIISNEGWFEAFFVWPLAQVINFLTPYVTVVGAIAIATLGINVLTFGFTVKSTVSSQKMQMIQPDIKKLQDKYKDRKDQQSQAAMAQEMQAIYSKNNVNPFGAILVPFMQLPIILAMWQAVQRSYSVVNGTIFGIELTTTPMQGLTNGHYILVVVFVLMGLAQFFSMRLPQILAKQRAAKLKKGPKTPDASDKSMNMVSIFMMVFILFLAVNWPTAMSLYWLVSSAVMIVKTLFIQWRYIDNEKV